MALGSDIKLFAVGISVYHAYKQEDGSHTVRHAVVDKVIRGRLLIRYDGSVVSVSPQDRRMSMTFEECSYVCRLLNRKWQREKNVQ